MAFEHGHHRVFAVLLAVRKTLYNCMVNVCQKDRAAILNFLGIGILTLNLVLLVALRYPTVDRTFCSDEITIFEL